MRWGALERELRSAGGLLLAGVDEVGRGPLAGPVVACAIVMRPDAPTINGVADSKIVPADERARLAAVILSRALSLGLGAASVREIDRFNIYHASTLAIRRAIRKLGVVPHHLLIDGRPIRSLGVDHRAVVGGDATCYSIACASIVAKVTRDRLMTALGRRHPAYLWERNAGYSTVAHLSALASAGITVHHRQSFAPVAATRLQQPGNRCQAMSEPVIPPVADLPETRDGPDRSDGPIHSGPRDHTLDHTRIRREHQTGAGPDGPVGAGG